MINVHKQLTEAGVKYTTEYVFDNFHGTRYGFPTLADARKAEKATGYSYHGKRGAYYFTLY